MTPGEANLLGQVIRQQIHQIPVSLVVQQRLVEELGVGVGLAGVGDGEVEVQCWGMLACLV
jgi:hypothetical protein